MSNYPAQGKEGKGKASFSPPSILVGRSQIQMALSPLAGSTAASSGVLLRGQGFDFCRYILVVVREVI